MLILPLAEQKCALKSNKVGEETGGNVIGNVLSHMALIKAVFLFECTCGAQV